MFSQISIGSSLPNLGIEERAPGRHLESVSFHSIHSSDGFSHQYISRRNIISNLLTPFSVAARFSYHLLRFLMPPPYMEY